MSSWRKYGGTDSFEKISDIRVNSLVTNYFTILNGITNDVDISGNLSVSKRFDVFGDVSFNENLSVAGNVNISKDLEISGNVHIYKDQIVDGNITVLDHLFFQMDVSNHFMYGNDFGIGINKYYPEAELDICGNQQCVLNVKSTLVNTKNILCRNVSDQSIMLSIDACNATIGFFHDIPLRMNALNAYPDAFIQYKYGGALVLDSSENIQVINNLIVSDISSNKVYDSTVTIYNELTDKVFLYDSYNVASARNSNAICNVAVDNSSNVGINLITKYNQSGAAIYGGVYPKNVNRKMLSFGTTDFSNHLYIPAQTIVSGSSKVVCKNTTGINRCTPKVDNYAVDINGSIHVENIDITTAANVPFQLNTMRFSRKYPNYGVAVGGVYKYSNTISNNYHSQQAYITTDAASSWYENSFLINNLNDTLQPIFTSYVYDSSYILIYGGTGIGFYLDISNNTWLSKRMQNQQIGEGDYAVIDMLITDSSGNKNSNNLSSKVFFIMANQARDSFQLRYFNAAFGKSAEYYNTANISSIQNGTPAKYVLYKNNGFSYNNSSYTNKYDDTLIEDYVSIFFRYELVITGRCIDGYSFPITTDPGTGYIYIAGKYDIRKYLYSDNSTNEIAIDVVEQYDCSHNPTVVPEYNAINVYDLSYVVAVGNGIISYTKDGGSNWVDISTNTAGLTIEDAKLRSVYAYDLSNAIAVGDNRKMLYTTDGATWKNIPPLLLDLSGTGFPLVDASLNDVFIFNKNAFVLSNRVSSFTMNADVSNIGNAKIVYNYVPELMNGENNSVLDLCGNMTIAGNIIIDRVNGNICSTANNLYISSNTPYTYIGDGPGSNKVTIGNKLGGTVLINSNCDVSYNMRIDGSGGLTITNGDIYMPNGLLTADRANIANFSMGVLDINGGTETTRNPDISYALHVGGYRPAVRFDASMSVQSLYVDDDAILYGSVISRSTTSPALLVQNAKAQFEYGLDVITDNGIINITSGLPVSLDPAENGGLYLENGTGAKIDGSVVVMRNMYIQGEGSIPSLIVSSGQSVFANIVVNGTTAVNTVDISGNLTVNGPTRVNKLDVSGNLDMSGNLMVRGDITYTGSLNPPSDYRIKQNVISLHDTSFNVDNIKPVYYYNTLANAVQIGFIAHELQEQYPFLVSGVKDGPEMQTVNYIGLIGVLVQEIKDLKDRVSLLENPQ
jgi:cytoskeletal protein CcmA (bactofilin family)